MSLLEVITFIQRRPNVFDVGPTLYKCYTNSLRLLSRARYITCVDLVSLCHLTPPDSFYWSKHIHWSLLHLIVEINRFYSEIYLCCQDGAITHDILHYLRTPDIGPISNQCCTSVVDGRTTLI